MVVARKSLPSQFTTRLAWDAYPKADACLAGTPWECELMVRMFDAPPARVHCVPNGVEPVFLQSQVAPRGPWLVCTATVTERKRVLELAAAAVLAKTPLWVIGQPYGADDPYALRFLALAAAHPGLVRYEGAIRDRSKLARVYREARGFVLLSTMESLSLSSFEAAACECPLLLSDLPWARTTFGAEATYCPITEAPVTARHLRAFYDAAPTLRPPSKPRTWLELVPQFLAVYEAALKTSR